MLNDPPWVVEIDGIKFATPEAVVLLLKSVSEERDELREALGAIEVGLYSPNDMRRIAKEALDD